MIGAIFNAMDIFLGGVGIVTLAWARWASSTSCSSR
jgi:hypothetical protein